MTQTIKFTKDFGRYKKGETRRFTNSDCVRLQRMGIAELHTPTGAEATNPNSRMITTEGRGRRRNSKAEDTAPASPPPPPPAPEPGSDEDDSSTAQPENS